MRRLPSIAPRTGRALIALFLAIKLLLLVWNAAAFDGRVVDAEYHADRALFGGLEPGSTAHDPPSYYLPALVLPRPDDVPKLASATAGEEGEPVSPPAARPARLSRAQKAFRAELLDWLRYTNVVWLGGFYLLWIYWLFPRLVRGFEPWFLASLLLLAVPGYQRLGIMPHPDNLFLGVSSLALAVWLFIRERAQASQVRLWHLVVFALTIGLLALTRWFAIVPAALLGVVLVGYAARSAGGDWPKRLLRSALLVAIVAVLSLSWHAALRRDSQAPDKGYVASYFPRFDQPRTGFSYGRYYFSFRAKQLLEDGGKSSERSEESVLDSFFTLVYSEIWGDQWSVFSSPKARTAKDWPERTLLTGALAVAPVLLVLGGASLWGFARRLRGELEQTKESTALARASLLLAKHERGVVLLALVVLSGGLFVFWQGTAALLPGDNSTVKFGYVAALFPALAALCCDGELESVAFTALSAYFLILNVLAFPVAMYWPM